jgi:hypothetical protein
MFQVIQSTNSVPTPKIAFDALRNVDAIFRGEGVALPSTFILDYLYGVAAYKAWGSRRGDGYNQMRAYRDKYYVNIPPLPSSAAPDEDRKDLDYHPPRKRPKRSDLEESMDELNMVLMYIHGITPEMAAERRQKEIEREERAAEEASRSKVMEWKDHLDVY